MSWKGIQGMIHLDVLEVHWVDSWADSSWTSSSEIDTDILPTISIGILSYESSDSIVLAISYDRDTDSWNPLISIPKSAIKKRKKICQLNIK